MNIDLDTVDPEWLGDGVNQLLCKLGRRDLIGTARQNGKFVTGQAGNRIGFQESRREGVPPPV